MAIPFRDPYADDEEQQWLSPTPPTPPTPPMQSAAASMPATPAAAPPAAAAPPLSMSLDEFPSGPSPAAASPVPPEPDDPNRMARIFDAGLQGLAGRQWDSSFWDKRAATQKNAARDARLRDPNSPESIHKRQVIQAMLGYKPDELNGLSAADLANFDPGRAVVSLAEARRSQAKTEEQRAYAEQQAEQKRIEDEKQWGEHNTVTSAQQDERARTMAGISSTRAVDQALLADDLTRKRQIDEESRRAKTTADTDARKAKSESDAMISPEELERSNEFIEVPNKKLFTEAISNRRLTGKAIDTVKAANRGVGIVKKLAETKVEFDALDPIDRMTSAKGRALMRKYEAHKQEYAGVIGQVSGSNTEKTHQESMALVPEIWNPYGKEGIEALYSPIETNVEGSLSPYGMRLNVRGHKPGSAPNAPAAPAAGGVRVRDPKTGRTGSYKGSPDEAAALGLEVLQ